MIMKLHMPMKIINAVGIFFLIAFLAIYFWVFWQLPSLGDLPQNLAVPSLRITDRYGRILYEVIDQDGGRHTPVPIESIPEQLIMATIATEDRSFYQNPGVDLLGILRAFWINIEGGETLAGGSTITQQVARNLLLTENEQFERTIRRKLRESWLAWNLTRKYTKDEIISFYLNQMYYGALAYGVEAAAQTYFGKAISDLSLAESALIAGIPQSPAIYNPLVDPQAAKKRQNIVLNLMLNQGIITQEQHNLAFQQPLEFTSSPYPIEAPHFVMMVIAKLDEIVPPESRISDQTLIVRTTLDLDWQHLAERAVTHHLEALNDPSTSIKTGGIESGRNVPGGHNVNNASLVALNPNSGEVMSFVGNHDYFDIDHNGAINMALSPRQPGSALKPLVYAAAFNPTRQNPYTAATMLMDVTTNFTTHEGDAYAPANYDNQEHGPVSVRQALASSLNIPAVIALDSIGLSDLFNMATMVGISGFGDPDDYDLSLALGGGEVNLVELSAAYGAFASHGFRLNPFIIYDITTLDGDLLYNHAQSPPKQVIDDRIAWLISDILNDNDARSLGFGTNSALKLDRPAAVKTGTTTNFHDNWTIGYTPDIVVGVWVGNANHEPMRGITGLSGAGPIWHQFIREILTGYPEKWYSKPPGLIQVEVCALSGLLPTEDCPYTKYEWFISGTEPTQPDNIFHKVTLDSETGLIANYLTPLHQQTIATTMDLPVLAHPWARDQGILLYSDLSRLTERQAIIEGNNLLFIIAPSNHASYWINSEQNSESQRVHIEAASSVLMNKVEFWLDGNLMKEVESPPFEFWWPLKPGQHTIWVEGTTIDGDIVTSKEIVITVEGGSYP